MKLVRWWFAGLFACAVMLSEASAERPVLRVPKMESPPSIDGVIDEEEWAGASAVTGFSTVTGPFPQQQHPADMRGVWHLGYDDRNLYLAMHLRIPEGVTPNAQTKNPLESDDENSILFGDHVEIQFSPHSAQRAMQTGFGFYKIIVNPFDVWSDYWHNCDEPGSESAWGSGATVKSTFDLNNWWLELAIPVTGTMKHPEGGTITQADGLELLMQLVNTGSCGGFSYAGWVPGSWLRWDDFYRVVLDPGAPVLQFLDTGDLVDGELHARLRMRGGEGETATVTLAVLDASGEPVLEASESVVLGNDWVDVGFREPSLDVPDWANTPKGSGLRNRLLLGVDVGGQTVYSAELPFAKQTDELRDLTYEAYKTSLPKGDYKTRIAYIARNGKFRVVVETDVLGDIPPAVRDAKQFRLRIRPEGGGDPLLERELAITDGVGSHLLALGEMSGAYVATLDLLDDQGGVVDAREHRFVRVRHDWEDNTLGEERVVIPPFRPIEVDGRTLATRMAEIELDDGGLWSGLRVLGQPMLAAPMRLEATVGETVHAWKGTKVAVAQGAGRAFPPEFDAYRYMKRDCPKVPFEELPETDGYEAVVTGAGTAGPVAVKLSATLDYDGYTRFRLTYGPANGTAAVDRLDLVLDLWGGVNGLAIARESGPVAFTLEKRDGVLWESASYVPRKPAFKGTFVPLLHLGDGSRALQFKAASDEGWLLDDEVSCMRVERVGNVLRLHLLLVNAPATLDRERTVDFALLPLPAKPAPPNVRHLTWGAPNRDYVHHAFGWRKYGTGADNWYLPDDEDYIRLGEYIRAGKIRDSAGAAGLGWTKPVMMYSSTEAVGAPLPDCDSFKGQWWKNSEVDFNKGNVQGGGAYRDPTGTYAWDRPECFTEARPYGWDDELIDNYLWFHRKLTVLTGSNGTYWDNAEIQHQLNLDAGTYGYVRDDGHVQPTNNAYYRRQLMKRLFTMGWMEGKPPLHHSKFPWNEPFQTFHYMMEGPYYIYSEGGTFFDGMPDLAHLRNCTRATLHTPAFVHPRIPAHENRAFDDSGQRSYFALLLLHDIGIGHMTSHDSELLRRIDDEIDFFSARQQADYTPYWETSRHVRFVRWEQVEKGREVFEEWEPEDVFVALYRSRTFRGRALLWFVNAGETMAVTGLWLDAKGLTGRGRDEVIVRNLETGVQLRKSLPRNITDERDREHLWANITVPPKDFRALIIEPGVDESVYRPWP